MDANLGPATRPKPATRGTRRTRTKNRGSQTCSSSDDDFHSDDNLRPYEEVKVAHHDKKLAGLGHRLKSKNVESHGTRWPLPCRFMLRVSSKTMLRSIFTASLVAAVMSPGRALHTGSREEGYRVSHGVPISAAHSPRRVQTVSGSRGDMNHSLHATLWQGYPP
ncbi:hypothetical protein BaRGS_00013426, partial [Batillaria attramentaria]